MRSPWIILAVAAIGLAAPAAGQQADQNTKQQIEKLAITYGEHFNKQDAAGIASLYAKDGVLVVSAAEKAAKTGAQEIERYAQEGFKMGFNHINITVDQVSPLGADAAIAMGEYHSTGQGEKGPLKGDGHWAAVDVREGGVWKIRLLTTVPNPPRERGGEGGQPPSISQEDRLGLVDDGGLAPRLASLKERLQLTPEQEKNWPAYEAALQALIRQGRERMQVMHEQGRSTDPVQRTRQRAEALSGMSAALSRLADAQEPLYNSLDVGQKRRLAMLSQMLGHHDMYHRWRDRDEDGDRRGWRDRGDDYGHRRWRDRDEDGHRHGWHGRGDHCDCRDRGDDYGHRRWRDRDEDGYRHSWRDRGDDYGHRHWRDRDEDGDRRGWRDRDDNDDD